VSSRFLVLSCLCVTMATAALADDAPDYSRTGFYGALSVAAGTPTGLPEYLASQDAVFENSRSDAAIGVQTRVGARMFSFLALEAQVEYLPGFDVKGDNDVNLIDGNLLVAALNARGYFLAWHDTGRFEPFVSLGIGLMQNWPGSLEDALTFATRMGGGFDGYFTEHLALTTEVQYVAPGGQNEEWDYVSLTVGLMYKF